MSRAFRAESYGMLWIQYPMIVACFKFSITRRFYSILDSEQYLITPYNYQQS